ncbi:MAG: transposase [Caballeronia sp.]|nr:transposase [Caballeronia sp.]
MGDSLESLPNDVGALKAALVAERGRRIVAETDAAFAKARASDDQALIAHLKLQIEKLNRDRYGSRSERTARLLDQLELTLEELEASATEDELAAEMVPPGPRTRRRPWRRSRASGHRASRSRIICRANASSYRVRRPAFAAAGSGCANCARPTPRRWNRFRGN